MPDPSELLSLEERHAYLAVPRWGLGSIVLGLMALAPGIAVVPIGRIVVATVGYLAVSLGPFALRRDRRVALPLMNGALLLDGIYLAAVVAFTGGAVSPLLFLVYVHVVAVTLLCSYRTGLKIALWHTMLFLLVVGSMDAGIIEGSTLGAGSDLGVATALAVTGLWLLALGTATAAAASERQLRRQKVDLASLSTMVARIDAGRRAEELPGILLDALCDTFGFERGIVLASPEGDLRVLAATDQAPLDELPTGLDPLIERVWTDRAPRLVRQIDPATDPRLAALLPGARNLLVVPLFREGGHALGAVAVERGGTSTGMRRWVVSMVEQFVAHAALALHNAWLTEDREAQLETIRGLERKLRAHNLELEVKVAERTEELRETIQSLEEVDEQRRRLLAHVVQAAEEERRRIANDIHDDPVQKMVVLKMRLELLAKANPQLPDLDDARAAVLGTIRSMRHMLFDLRPPILDEEGLGPAIRYFLENSEIECEWSVEDELVTGPSTQTRVILYRIAQEALTNARKHAQADEISVKLQERDGGVWMEVSDDGVGYTPEGSVVAAPGHLGVAAMRERAEMAAGWCTLRSLPGAGTTLEVWLPHEEADDRPQPTMDEDAMAISSMRTDRIA
ncbi:MAG: GAF domain-containing sensor histidine kinase [Actinomycetota bacterium]|nr:GAF domain-containing sensor histidine kinase [Actinomycetota bacterium]